MSGRGTSASARKASATVRRSACRPHGIHVINNARVNLNYIRTILNSSGNVRQPNTNTLLEKVPIKLARSILKYMLKCRMGQRTGRLNAANPSHKLEMARLMKALLRLTTGYNSDPQLFTWTQNGGVRIGNRAVIEGVLHI